MQTMMSCSRALMVFVLWGLAGACGPAAPAPEAGLGDRAAALPDGLQDGGQDGPRLDGGRGDGKGEADRAGALVWSSFSTAGKTLTLVSDQKLIVNAPFYGIEVRKNGTDITDDIVEVTSLSPSSWRYTFGTQILSTPGDAISISLQNGQLAAAGHYVAVREGGASASTVPTMFQLIADCQAGNKGACVGDAPVPGLLAAVKGLSRRYLPRDLQAAPDTHDFSPVLADAAFLAGKGLRLHVIFTIRTFARQGPQDGDGSTKVFNIPAGWDKGRDREVHAYVNGVDTPFTFNAARTQVILGSAPPPGTGNVKVMWATDPFPEHTWKLTPPVGGWYEGSGGNFGFVHAPWRQTCVEWMRAFMQAFRTQWTAALTANPQLAHAIDAVSIQETANGLGGAGYTEATYRAGLVEYAKIYARAVRRRAIHGQLINQIAGGGGQALADLAVAIAPWGSRLEGPDLFNNNAGLEANAYERVHRQQHELALTMIWAQHDSYAEARPGGGFFTMQEQFDKARKTVTDSSTAGGHPGLEAESVFWNMTQGGPGFGYKDALPVIASHPVIQANGNDRNRWRLQSTGAPIADQVLDRVN